jgi:hypothetical protein
MRLQESEVSLLQKAEAAFLTLPGSVRQPARAALRCSG